MRNGIWLCLLWFVAGAGVAEQRLVLNESIWPELQSLLADASSYKGCSVQLNDGEYWGLRIVDNASNDAYLDFDGHRPGEFDYIRMYSYITGDKYFYDKQELRISGGRAELEVIRYREWVKSGRGGGLYDGMFGASGVTVGFIKRTLQMVVEDGEVQKLDLHDRYHRKNYEALSTGLDKETGQL